MKCDLCGCEAHARIFNYARFEKRDILQCRSCGLVRLQEDRDQGEIMDFYRHGYREASDFPIQSPEEHYRDLVTVKDSQDRLKWLSHRVELQGLRLLEIGSASGHFLKVVREQGALPVGIELTQDYVAFSRKLGLEIYDCPLTELDLQAEFDIVVSFHCMEHILQPSATFQAIARALKDHALFMGEVPNQDDWRLKVFDNPGVKRLHYDPNHYTYFSPETLSRYLIQSQFKIENLGTVERYDTLLQLKRILSGDYEGQSPDAVLHRDIFAAPEADVRINQPHTEQELAFGQLVARGINQELMGNCLRWIATRGSA